MEQFQRKKIYLISLTLVTTMGIKSCKTIDKSLTLDIKKVELLMADDELVDAYSNLFIKK